MGQMIDAQMLDLIAKGKSVHVIKSTRQAEDALDKTPDVPPTKCDERNENLQQTHTSVPEIKTVNSEPAQEDAQQPGSQSTSIRQHAWLIHAGIRRVPRMNRLLRRGCGVHDPPRLQMGLAMGTRHERVNVFRTHAHGPTTLCAVERNGLCVACVGLSCHYVISLPSALTSHARRTHRTLRVNVSGKQTCPIRETHTFQHTRYCIKLAEYLRRMESSTIVPIDADHRSDPASVARHSHRQIAAFGPMVPRLTSKLGLRWDCTECIKLVPTDRSYSTSRRGSPIHKMRGNACDILNVNRDAQAFSRYNPVRNSGGLSEPTVDPGTGKPV